MRALRGWATYQESGGLLTEELFEGCESVDDRSHVVRRGSRSWLARLWDYPRTTPRVRKEAKRVQPEKRVEVGRLVGCE